MNSQDNPLEFHDNRDEPAVDGLENTGRTVPQNEELDSSRNDLWINENSELDLDVFSDETDVFEDRLPSLAEVEESPESESEIDLELSKWDFRNPLDRKTNIESSYEVDKSEFERLSESEVSTKNLQDSARGETEFIEEIELDEEISLEENSPSFALDIERGETEFIEEIELDEEISLEENSLSFALDTERGETEFIEEIELDEEISLEENSLSFALDTERGETEFIEDYNLDTSLELENLELETAESNLDGQLELTDPLSEEANGDVDSNDLDNLLLSQSGPELLNSTNSDSSLDSIELDLSLDSNLELASLDAIVGLSESENNLPPQSSSVVISSPVAKVQSIPEAETAAKLNVFDPTMRVSVRKLDNLNNLIGELVVKRNRLEEDQERLRRFLDNLLGHVQSLGEAGTKMHDMYERSLLEGALLASRQSNVVASRGINRSGFSEQGEQLRADELDALEMDRFTGFHLLSQEIIELIVRVREAASDIQFVVDESDKVTQTLRQVTTQLQEGMNSSRMVAFGLTADRLPRAIREISRQQKKQAKLNVEGKEVLIDKMIVEHLYNPMTHLVNNAISHGIESPEERIRLSKPVAGNINIKAFIQGNQTVITVADDGAGIDSEKVKNKAVEKNLLTWAEAQNLTQPEIYDLLFHPGFSTKDKADDFAGRGVGMDVVLTDLKKIRGTISIESQKGQGTTFTIRLPLVLSICKALICVDNNNPIAFPIDGVENTLEYFADDIQVNENGVRCISWQNKLLPLRPLSSLLTYNRQIRRGSLYSANNRDEDTIAVIILRSVDNFLAVEVDEVQAEQEIVIKQIEGSLAKPPGIAGATVLGDGKIMPIGDVLELIEIAQGRRTIKMNFELLERLPSEPAETQVRQEPMVLVVDDSITVRELLSMSFNKLGYRVEQARDGQEAWDKLRGGLPCDMIFCDIEMPRMNGLELLSNLQKHEGLKRVPVAMLTSRGADKHRQLASELGAQAYLTKPYTEKDLMDVAQRLIEVNRVEEKTESVASAEPAISEPKFDNLATSNSESSDAPLVLVIDDSVTIRELLSMTFKKAGYRVEQARDGREAWEKLKQGIPCDVAFCDIEMPRMNGLELLSQLQQDEKLCTLPIAMLTSRGAQKMRNIAAQKGAKGYFVKPYVEDSLLDAAKRMINGEILLGSIELD